MKKFTLKKLRYKFDRFMTKGTIPLIGLLFAVCLIVISIIGLFSSFSKVEGSFFYHIWESLLHTLDPGTISGTSTEDTLFIVMMTISTFFGLIFTSILIGIISTGFEEKLSNLRKGTSVVQEENHTVIIGFNDNIYTILSELVEANSNHKNMCVVVLGEQDKTEMEDAISAHIPDTRTTHIVCRSGSLHEFHSLERCNIENSRAVIINKYDDADVIKIILALTTYLKGKTLLHEDLSFTAVMQDSENIEAATIAGEGYAEIIFAKDAISRIIAHTCREHGLSEVMVELFQFDGDELYFEDVPSLVGKTFHETLSCFTDATVFGIYNKKTHTVKMNPPMDTVFTEDDQIVIMEEDDGSFHLSDNPTFDESLIFDAKKSTRTKRNNMLILGNSEKLPLVLAEFDNYVNKGTKVIIVDESPIDDFAIEFKNIEISTITCSLTHKTLEQLLTDEIDNILVTCDENEDAEHSDSKILQLLIFLRNIADKTGKEFAITTEMQKSDNQRLAAKARVDDFVIGSNLVNLMMTQIAENRNIKPLIEDLLDEDGSELYMKPAVNYVKPDVEVDFYTLTESAARKNEIFVGYKTTVDGLPHVVTNPHKSEKVTLSENDLVIVIAEDL
ncbi:MAG: hypothetical protein IIX27_07740 [Ruminococcus sp.]|nr:hypothetical protein [Ruminococcus sp.]